VILTSSGEIPKEIWPQWVSARYAKSCCLRKCLMTPLAHNQNLTLSDQRGCRHHHHHHPFLTWKIVTHHNSTISKHSPNQIVTVTNAISSIQKGTVGRKSHHHSSPEQETLPWPALSSYYGLRASGIVCLRLNVLVHRTLGEARDLCLLSGCDPLYGEVGVVCYVQRNHSIESNKLESYLPWCMTFNSPHLQHYVLGF